MLQLLSNIRSPSQLFSVEKHISVLREPGLYIEISEDCANNFYVDYYCYNCCIVRRDIIMHIVSKMLTSLLYQTRFSKPPNPKYLKVPPQTPYLLIV